MYTSLIKYGTYDEYHTRAISYNTHYLLQSTKTISNTLGVYIQIHTVNAALPNELL